VVVANDFGSVTSRVAVLTVINPADLPTFLTNGLVAWWPGNGNARDAIGGNDGTLQERSQRLGRALSGKLSPLTARMITSRSPTVTCGLLEPTTSQ